MIGGSISVNEITFIRRNSRQNYSDPVRDAKSEVYVDAHENFFTPLSFLMLAEELFYLGEINLYANVLTRFRGCEFSWSSRSMKREGPLTSFFILNANSTRYA